MGGQGRESVWVVGETERENENMYQGPEKRGKEKRKGERKGRGGRLRGREEASFKQ